MKKNSFTEMIFKNAGYIVVVLVSVLYVASSLINVSTSGKSVYEIIATGVLSLIVGVMINGSFRSMGIRRGDEDERTVATNQLHAKTVEEITPYIDRLDEFCDGENKRAVREVRARILMREGMKYSDYFDEEGNAKCKGQNARLRWEQAPTLQKPSAVTDGGLEMQNAKRESLPQSPAVTAPSSEGALEGQNARLRWEQAPTLQKPSAVTDGGLEMQNAEFGCGGDSRIARKNDKAREKAYRRALRVKVKPLVSSNLTSDGVKADEPFDFGRSKREYTARHNAGDVLVKLIMAVLFGYFGVSLASEVNVASLIWNGLQIVLYITGGVIQMYNSFMWVVDDYRGSVVKKIDYLQKFKRVTESA